MLGYHANSNCFLSLPRDRSRDQPQSILTMRRNIISAVLLIKASSDDLNKLEHPEH
jgi:hypothetical protein